jgi:membrane-associated phospholipid phosphatase
MEMKKIKENIMALCLMMSIPLLNILYGVLNNGDRGVYSLMTDIDRGIPFLKIFIIPYVAWYLFLSGTLVYFCLKNRETYYKTLISLDLGLLICYGVYFFYQTTVPRPLLVGEDTLTRMVSWVYATDQPFNCFPSIHSLASYLMFKGIRHSSIRNKRNQLIISSIAFTIILSTLFVKQHAVLDAIVAIFLGEILFNLINNIYWRKGEAHEKYILNIGKNR